MINEHFDCLVALGTFDALAAVAILTKLSEDTASHELRDMALDCYARLQLILADAPETCMGKCLGGVGEHNLMPATAELSCIAQIHGFQVLVVQPSEGLVA